MTQYLELVTCTYTIKTQKEQRNKGGVNLALDNHYKRVSIV